MTLKFDPDIWRCIKTRNLQYEQCIFDHPVQNLVYLWLGQRYVPVETELILFWLTKSNENTTSLFINQGVKINQKLIASIIIFLP